MQILSVLLQAEKKDKAKVGGAALKKDEHRLTT
jgi:hypothetical protein